MTFREKMDVFKTYSPVFSLPISHMQFFPPSSLLAWTDPTSPGHFQFSDRACYAMLLVWQFCNPDFCSFSTCIKNKVNH